MKAILTAKYYEAIKQINNNFNGSVFGNTHDDIIINWNGITEISVSDIKAKITEMETAEQTAKTTEATNKTNGKQKLLDLGLTEAEVKALIGV